MIRIENLYFVILSVGGLGLFLFYLGWYRRVYDGGLYCRGCGYRVDRSGDDVVRCSECGKELGGIGGGSGRGGGVVGYQRKRQPVLVAVGVLLIVMSAAGITVDSLVNFNSINWYRYLPTWYLLRSEVTADANFGNNAVSELRTRVLDNGLDEGELRKFTVLLCRRATNLHRVSRGGGMQYTGMTMNLLKDYKPNETEVDALLRALVRYFIDSERHSAGLDSQHVLWVALPLFRCEPMQPFLHRGDVSSVRMYGTIVEAEAVVGGRVLEEKETGESGFWYSAFDAAGIENGASITLRLTIDWHIEDVDGGDEGGAESNGGSGKVWDTFVYECELRPSDMDDFAELGEEIVGDAGRSGLIQRYEVVEPGSGGS